MQRLGELVKKYRTGGDLPGDGVDDEKKKKTYDEYAADEGFKAFLESTGGTYSPQYSGAALHTGGGSGSVRTALGDTSYANMAVDPTLLPLESGYGNERYGNVSSPGARRNTRGEQMQTAADMWSNNRQMEINYEEWLARQSKKPGPVAPVYEVKPGARNEAGVQTRSDGFRITGG